jgi:NAD(P)-dependent dehydrogenase (short-subunit alcohol dehydrogenase family)
VRSLVFAAQGAIDLMQAGGSIVLIGSIADELGRKRQGVYASSKAAVRSFARTWANELGPQGHPRQCRHSRSHRYHLVESPGRGTGSRN